jgi:hypothetical protein
VTRARGDGMFWLGVSAVYLALIGVGLLVGHWLAGRRRGWGRGREALPPARPTGPTFALDIPPLGTSFDQGVLPGVLFTDVPVVADAA